MTAGFLPPYLTDEEIDGICAGLTQSAAKVRFLRGLGLPVDRKPNGFPLVRRIDWDRRQQPAQNGAPAPANGPKWKVPA